VSRSASPSRLNDTTVNTIARPGKTLIHHAWRMKSRPSFSARPHVGVEGLTPNPRNDKVDSERMPRPTAKVSCTVMGATMLGRMWRAITRRSVAPTVRAAKT